MAVKTYSLKKDGDKKLSDNFKVKEFRCNDGSDEVLIDTKLIEVLQKIRDEFKRPVIINSGYRTVSYNKKIGGASSSFHCKGNAADISVSGVSPLKAALFAESIMEKGGIGCYSYVSGGFVHIDTRDYKSRWVQAQPEGTYDVVNKIMPCIMYGECGQAVKIAQRELDGTAADGIFGEETLEGVKAFQKEQGLTVDGIIGDNTWREIGER